LHWWINTGASFTEKVAVLPQPQNIKPVLAALQSGTKNEEIAVSYIPEATVDKADETTIKKLRERGVAITSVAQNSNYLSASFIAVDSITIQDIELLVPLSKQLIWLKLGNSNCTDATINTIDKLTGLTRLSLENTAITDNAFKQLKNLSRLQYLNVAGNNISTAGLEQLKEVKQLRNLYIYKTSFSAPGFANLKKLFPGTMIDTGGYIVPILNSDTTLVTKPK
jgi:Leucine-rich repeat (LRR) protein